MLMIQFQSYIATWDNEEKEWDSPDSVFEAGLNDNIPDEIWETAAPFRTGGCQAIALRGARELLGSELKIIKSKTPLSPPEEEGVDH
jgi:hypothetical protein